MAKSNRDICNLALSHIAFAQGINNLETDTSTQAIECNKFYDTILKEVLRAYVWPFAIRDGSLGESKALQGTGKPSPAYYHDRKQLDAGFENEVPQDAEVGYLWAYYYKLPTDCIRFIEVVSGYRYDTRETKVPFKEGLYFVKTDSKEVPKQVIYTDKAKAWGKWIVEIKDVSFYPEDFISAFSYRLASAISPSLSAGDKMKLGEVAFQRYQMMIKQAEGIAATEKQRDIPPASKIRRARRM